ncbi:MAG TPA: NADH-quinone oxidoreductase subunit M [Armatimonadetes bacterium]|nr:NADH-quinone oxidoreductase subunit M [Armatimonadota bacterium]
MDEHFISWMTFLPIAGMVIIILSPRRWEAWIKWVAVVFAAISFVLSAWMYANFLHLPPQNQRLTAEGPNPFEEWTPWIPAVNITYRVAVDGLSLPLIVLTTLLTLLSLIYSWDVIKERIKEYYAFFLLLETGMLGVFVSLDFFLFYVFWEVSLVPMYFIIGIWGGPKREYAAIKFFLYTLAGSLAMLLGILTLYFYSEPHTFDMLILAREQPLARPELATVATLVFWGMFLGFAIKVPMWPFHTWLPDAHVEAPTAGSVILAGILLKMGTYGFVRILLPLLPEQCEQFCLSIALLAMISIIYGALVAMAQPDFKKLIAYSSVNHMGYVMLGWAAASSVAVKGVSPEVIRPATVALNGATMQMVAHGIITGSLFLLVGVLYERAHTRMLDDFGGLAAHLPSYSGVLTTASLASLGLPGMVGFVSEFMVFTGSLSVGVSGATDTSQDILLITCLSLLGIIITAAYFLWMIQRVLLGPVKERWKALPDMNWGEWISLAPLVALMISLGLYPAPLLNVINNTMSDLLSRLTW